MSQYWYTGRDKGSEIVALDLSHLREVEREEKTPFSDAIVGSYTSANTHQALWSRDIFKAEFQQRILQRSY
ncbi:hypothetical protein C5167_043797 [Papaver somniferum]|uniref:Uncharacterized protein n=1 Tax=Papaver somniferum TaxID=3469 RepID=A0A4Y7L6R9_PAPSO|nr:hypothetical protein C5167_043797 [Papaver somniferum]